MKSGAADVDSSLTDASSDDVAHGQASPQVLETVEVTIPGTLQYRDMVTRTTSLVCRRLRSRGQLDNDEFMQQVVSATSEAFNNIVIHSYEGAADAGYVTLIFHIFANELEVVLLDYGQGAPLSQDTYDEVREVELEIGVDAAASRMRMSQEIMRRCVDDIKQQLGRPNRLSLYKRLPTPASSTVLKSGWTSNPTE